MFLQGPIMGVVEYFHYEWFHHQFGFIQDIPPPAIHYLHLEDAPMLGVSLLTYSLTILRASEDALEEDELVDDVGTTKTFTAWWDIKLAEFFRCEETSEHPTQRVQVDTAPKVVTEEPAGAMGGDDFTMENFEGLGANVEDTARHDTTVEEVRVDQPKVPALSSFERGECNGRSATSYEAKIAKL